MRWWIVPALLLWAIVATSQTKPADSGVPASAAMKCSSADESALRRIPAQWKDGYNNKDAARVASLYSEDAYYLTQHFATGIVHPRTNIQAYMQRGVDVGYHVDAIDVLSLECSGDFAYTITRYRATNGGEKAMGVNLVVLHKTAGQWLIVAHEAAVPDPATAVQSLDEAKPR
jgi:uncharacterized protein (TIGR02246 family)